VLTKGRRGRACIPVFHPEYGRYMLESTPGMPYGATLEDLLSVEGNMKFRFVPLSHLRRS
jgi:glutamate--cysteine ligase catalytic subunit